LAQRRKPVEAVSSTPGLVITGIVDDIPQLLDITLRPFLNAKVHPSPPKTHRKRDKVGGVEHATVHRPMHRTANKHTAVAKSHVTASTRVVVEPRDKPQSNSPPSSPETKDARDGSRLMGTGLAADEVITVMVEEAEAEGPATLVAKGYQGPTTKGSHGRYQRVKDGVQHGLKRNPFRWRTDVTKEHEGVFD